MQGVGDAFSILAVGSCTVTTADDVCAVVVLDSCLVYMYACMYVLVKQLFCDKV